VERERLCARPSQVFTTLTGAVGKIDAAPGGLTHGALWPAFQGFMMVAETVTGISLDAVAGAVGKMMLAG